MDFDKVPRIFPPQGIGLARTDEGTRNYLNFLGRRQAAIHGLQSRTAAADRRREHDRVYVLGCCFSAFHEVIWTK